MRQQNISPGLCSSFVTIGKFLFSSSSRWRLWVPLENRTQPTTPIIIPKIIEQPLVPVRTEMENKRISHRKSKQFLQLSLFISLNVFSALLSHSISLSFSILKFPFYSLAPGLLLWSSQWRHDTPLISLQKLSVAFRKTRAFFCPVLPEWVDVIFFIQFRAMSFVL